MKKRYLMPALALGLAAAALGAAVSAPAEVLDNLQFFSDLDLLANLDILEDEPMEAEPVNISTPAVPTPALISTAAVRTALSTETVKISTFTGRTYEKR